MNRLGRRLQAARIEAGLGTAEDIAPIVGKSPRQVRNYESGRTAEIPATVLQRWAEATGKPIEYFLADPPSEDTPSGHSHPGVRELAAEAALCRAHKVSVDELQQLAGLRIVSLTGQPIVIQTAAQALAYLQALRQSTPHP